jgi:hypothetical protein
MVETTEDLAVEGGPGIANIVRHGTGETDTRAVKVMHYDAGTGSVPTIGEVMTQGSATGNVLDYEGDAVSGILVLETWNGTEYINNNTVSGGTSTFSAQTDISGDTESFYEEYTWVWDLGGNSLQSTYDYQAAKFSSRPHPIAKQDDGTVFTTFTDEAKSDAAGDVDLLPTTPVQNDAFYFGDANFPFETITLNVSTAATTSTIAWEYYNGTIWTALGSVSDGTTNFTTTGKNIVTYTLPADWTTIAIDGTTAFWVRARQSNASPSGQAVATQVWLDEKIERLIEWGEDEHAYQVTVSGSGYRTDRNVTNTEGVWLANRGAGSIDAMTADDGTEYVPPVQRTLTYSNLVAGTEVRIYNTGTGVELAGIESSGTSFAYSYIYSTDIGVTSRINKVDKIFITRTTEELLNLDQTIPISQANDPNYLNPV